MKRSEDSFVFLKACGLVSLINYNKEFFIFFRDQRLCKVVIKFEGQVFAIKVKYFF